MESIRQNNFFLETGIQEQSRLYSNLSFMFNDTYDMEIWHKRIWSTLVSKEESGFWIKYYFNIIKSKSEGKNMILIIWKNLCIFRSEKGRWGTLKWYPRSRIYFCDASYDTIEYDKQPFMLGKWCKCFFNGPGGGASFFPMEYRNWSTWA